MKVNKTFSLSIETVERLKAIAANEKRTFSAVIEIAINEHYKKRKNEKN